MRPLFASGGMREQILKANHGCVSRSGWRETAFFDFELSDNNSFEQWSQEGAHDILWRANHKWKAMLDAYQPPVLDPGKNEALLAFIAVRKASMPDTDY